MDFNEIWNVLQDEKMGIVKGKHNQNGWLAAILDFLAKSFFASYTFQIKIFSIYSSFFINYPWIEIDHQSF